jgi:hypothetical protein
MIFMSSRHADPGHDITHRNNAVTQQSLSLIFNLCAVVVR